MGRDRFLGGCALLASLALPAAAQELALGTSPRLTFERTNRRLPRTGDPIWDLKVEIPGQPVRHFDAVSGRAEFQGASSTPRSWGRSGLALNPSSRPGGGSWASTSTPAPAATGTAEPAAALV